MNKATNPGIRQHTKRINPPSHDTESHSVHIHLSSAWPRLWPSVVRDTKCSSTQLSPQAYAPRIHDGEMTVKYNAEKDGPSVKKISEVENLPEKREIEKLKKGYKFVLGKSGCGKRPAQNPGWAKVNRCLNNFRIKLFIAEERPNGLSKPLLPALQIVTSLREV